MSTTFPNRDRHLSYWLRCLHTCLPSEYITGDLTRLTLAFFTTTSLDLLSALPPPPTLSLYTTWIYTLQHPSGGFRGSPATASTTYDPAHLPATCFAIVTLITLGDDLSRLNRRGALELLPKLQRKDGSFGEWLCEGEIVGGVDMRYMYFVAAIRWALRGDGRGLEGVADIDVEKARGFVESARTYDGGWSEKEFGEAHAGMAYCAVAAMGLLGGEVGRREELVRWLVARQVPFTGDEDDEEEEEARGEEVQMENGRVCWGGFNGRCNKLPDTCYSFWVGASLEMLGDVGLMDVEANKRFLLEKTQHRIGGFSKVPGGFPDIMHSFLGLAALALVGQEGLEELDPALCITLRAKKRIMELDWWKECNDTKA